MGSSSRRKISLLGVAHPVVRPPFQVHEKTTLFRGREQGQKNRFFRPIFRRKIGFRWCWKRFSSGKIVCKKIGKKSEKIADFSVKNRKNPIFSRKNPIFPEIWGKLYFRSLRGEKLKNGANQSCRIKKKVYFWEK